jgi:hypothetical protein
MGEAANPVELKPETLLAFSEYIREAEASMDQTVQGEGAFLWSDGNAERTKEICEGKTIAQLWSGTKPIAVPDGLIHDWIAATRIPGTSLEKALALLQDYDNHKNVYKPEVIDSKLISRNGNDFHVYLRLLKKKIITVVLDTYHDVHYFSPESTRWCIRSYTSRISEVEDAGRPDEKVLQPDTGNGFLWRLYSYWRFEEKDGGVRAECRAISLSRDVPRGLGLIVDPIVKKLPRASLIGTLESTRRALSQDAAPASGGSPNPPGEHDRSKTP